jgi:hypothetical protein
VCITTGKKPQRGEWFHSFGVHNEVLDTLRDIIGVPLSLAPSLSLSISHLMSLYACASKRIRTLLSVCSSLYIS